MVETVRGPSLLLRIAELRAWLFLILLTAFFEVWLRLSYGTSFVLSAYNIQAITVFAAFCPMASAVSLRAALPRVSRCEPSISCSCLMK